MCSWQSCSGATRKSNGSWPACSAGTTASMPQPGGGQRGTPRFRHAAGGSTQARATPSCKGAAKLDWAGLDWVGSWGPGGSPEAAQG